MALENSLITNTTDRELVSTRIFNVPREIIFDAWIDPAQLAQWWGPKDFTNTIYEFDPRPGGTWKFTMHGPDGIDYPNTSVFVEIIKPERIVFQHLKPVHEFQATATFDDLGGKTKLTFRMRFETAAECERVKIVVAEANEENFDRLETCIAKNLN